MTLSDKSIAIVVDPTLPLGLIANTAATIGIGLGAAETGFGGTTLTDIQGWTVRTSSNRPVPVLQADAAAIAALLLKALPAPEGAMVVPFPRFARGLHKFEDYLAQFPGRDLAGEAVDGLGLAGPAKWVRSLTGSLRLLR